jgi:hypothetical protein
MFRARVNCASARTRSHAGAFSGARQWKTLGRSAPNEYEDVE